jgi:hypothetical protein
VLLLLLCGLNFPKYKILSLVGVIEDGVRIGNWI